MKNITRADEYGTKKGAIKVEVVVTCENEFKLNIVNTHLGAISDPQKINGEYVYDTKEIKSHKNQVKELLKFIKADIEKSNLVLMGDLNIHHLNHNTKDESDVYALVGKDFLDTFESLNLQTDSVTFDANNKYVSSGHFRDSPSERIDYIFTNHQMSDKGIMPIDSKVVFNQANQVVSDHYGVLTTLACPK